MRKSNAVIRREQGKLIRTEVKEIKVDLTTNNDTDYSEIYKELEDELMEIVRQVKSLKKRAEEIKKIMEEIKPLIKWKV